MKGALIYRSVACTHQGLVRHHNEDAYLDRPDLGLWVVADGMGGMTAGDVASQAIVQSLDAIAPQASGTALINEIRRRLNEVNVELHDLAERRAAPSAIGSTVAGLAVFADHFACFWAGDSRIYRLRAGELDRLTRDHSLVQEMVDAGVLRADQAESHPYAHIIQRAVGVDETLELEFNHARIQPGDIFLLCSDGLTRMVGDEELEREISRLSIDQASEVLLASVLQRGAKDNVTIILIACCPAETPPALR